VIAAGLVVIVSSDPAQAQNGNQKGTSHCSTWAALRGKCAKAVPNTDDILDYPRLYADRDVTLEGRVDRMYSLTVTTMEDNYDLIPSGDRILMISVLPAGAKVKNTAAADGDRPLPIVESVELLQREFKHGKIIRASGTVRIFDRAALEQEFGPINFGSTPVQTFQNEPVLLIGAREFAAYRDQHKVLQQAVVIEEERAAVIAPEPVPPREPEVERTPQPEALQPEPQPEPQATVPAPPVTPEPENQRPSSLPKTASPIPLIGVIGLLAVAFGLGTRAFRKSV